MYRDADEVRDGNAEGGDHRWSDSRNLAKLRATFQWDNKFSFYAALASLLPFGPFVFDKRLRDKEATTN